MHHYVIFFLCNDFLVLRCDDDADYIVSMGVWVDLVAQHRNGMRYDHTYEYISQS